MRNLRADWMIRDGTFWILKFAVGLLDAKPKPGGARVPPESSAGSTDHLTSFSEDLNKFASCAEFKVREHAFPGSTLCSVSIS